MCCRALVYCWLLVRLYFVVIREGIAEALGRAQVLARAACSDSRVMNLVAHHTSLIPLHPHLLTAYVSATQHFSEASGPIMVHGGQ